MKLLSSLVVAASLVLAAGCASQSVPPAQSVSFLQPVDGATVTSPFVVKFGVTGMQVQPAGTMAPDTGHHHLLINAEDVATMAVIPMDETHLHFGKGQTETTVTLKPGKYKLTMQFGNGAHQAYGPAMSKSIQVTVQ
ncbi:MAG: DUF4399 domain-containing protein [Herminiimonas sp.]|nr:DUF4399 domain-containing protein [Herminiimonas sp.]